MKRYLSTVGGLLVGAALVFVGLRALPGESQDADREVRYGNVVLTIPGGEPDLHVGHYPPQRPGDGWLIRAYVEGPRDLDADEEDWPVLVIDPETGGIVSDTLTAAHPAAAAAIIASLRVESEVPEAWPYGTSDAPAGRRQVGNIEYAVPDPRSGIQTVLTKNLCPDGVPSCAPLTLGFTNGDSLLTLDADGGNVIERSVAPTDDAAFDRLVADIRVVTQQPQTEGP
jgi:hypothetical protein